MPRKLAYVKSFHLNHEGIEKIGLGPKARVMVREEAEKARVFAISISPEKDGVYKASFRVKLHIRRDWPLNSPYRSPRVCADLANVAPHAIIVERGVRKTGGEADGEDVVDVRRHQFRVLGKTLLHMAATGGIAPRRARR